MPPTSTVVIAANSDWNIVTFRQGLVRAIQAAGYKPVAVAPPDPAAEQRIAALEIDRVHLDIQRSGLNPFADLRLLIRYARLLRTLAPVAFLGFTIKPNIYGCIAARFARVPAIANISGLGTVFVKPGLLTKLIVKMYRFALARTTIVFFQNRDDRALFIDKGIVRPEQARLLPGSGIDLRQYVPVPLPEGPPTFLLIARLLGDKGVREFVRAAQGLRERLPGARFQLLGPVDEGNRTAIARAELESWIADGAIEYLGTADDVRPFIAAASAVVLPSYREGLPRALLEGAALGRPLIASYAPGCREIVDDGVNGFLCAARDSASLADAMERFAALSSETRCRMAQAARARVEAAYSEELVVKAYIDALAEIAPAAGSEGRASTC